MLGIILSVLLVAGEVFIYFFDYYVTGSQREIMFHELVANLFAAVYLYFECMLLGVIVAFFIVSRYEPDPDKDFLIILGCGLRKDGTPSPLLRGRCGRAGIRRTSDGAPAQAGVCVRRHDRVLRRADRDGLSISGKWGSTARFPRENNSESD